MNKRLTAMAVTAATLATASTATAGTWKPGTPNLITEDDATTFLEHRFDHAYCQGIPRFGHTGEFPDEEFVVFECSVERADKGIDCVGVHMKAVKGTRRGYFSLKLTRDWDAGATCV